jgi:hypothetical protein
VQLKRIAHSATYAAYASPVQEKEKLKKEKEEAEAKYKWAIVDGRKEQVCLLYHFMSMIRSAPAEFAKHFLRKVGMSGR